MDGYVAEVINEILKEKPDANGFITVSCVNRGIGDINYMMHGILRTLSVFGFFQKPEFCRMESYQRDGTFAKILLSTEKREELEKLLSQ